MPTTSAARLLDEPRPRPRPVRAPPSGRQPGRRTVEIRGHGAPVPAPRRRLVEVQRRRPRPSAVDRLGPRPDRIALYAFLLGVLLVVVAAMSSSGA